MKKSLVRLEPLSKPDFWKLTWSITTWHENKTIHKYLMACLMVVLCGYFFFELGTYMPLIMYAWSTYIYLHSSRTLWESDVYHGSRTKLNHFICIVQHQKDWERSYRINYRTIVANLQLWQVFVYIISKLIDIICQGAIESDLEKIRHMFGGRGPIMQ